MVLLQTSYRYGGLRNTILNYNLMRLGVSVIKLHHDPERMLIFKMYPSPKTELPPEKKLTPHHLKNPEHPD